MNRYLISFGMPEVDRQGCVIYLETIKSKVSSGNLFNRRIGVYQSCQGAEQLTTTHKLVKRVIKMYSKSIYITPLIESTANINFKQLIDKEGSFKTVKKKLQSSIEGFKKVLALERSFSKRGEVAKNSNPYPF